MSQFTKQQLLVAAILAAGCGPEPQRAPTAPAFLVTMPTGVATLKLSADAAPGNFVPKGGCLQFHAKAYDNSVPARWLSSTVIFWTYFIDGDKTLSFDGVTTPPKTSTKHPSSDAVSVCGVADGFGSIQAWVDPNGIHSEPFNWDIDVGKAAATIDINAPASLQPGQSTQLQAMATDQFYVRRDRTTQAAWSGNNDAVATVSPSGFITARTPGLVTVSALLYGTTGTRNVVVLGPVETVQVSPATASVTVGSAKTLNAIARDANGYVISGARAAWTTSDAGIATVTTPGASTTARGVAPGQVTVTATISGKSGTGTFTVTPAPPTVSISGPQQVALHESALYNANVGGGLAPFHYQWRSRQCYDVGGSNCGTWSPYNAIGDGYDRPYSYASINACGLRRNELQVLVTDANNLSASSPVFVITITNPC